MLKTILVDDERPALNALLHLLKAYPEVEVVEAFTDMDHALQRIRQGDIHLIFLDIDMPKLNGIQAAKEIASLGIPMDIVFVTAYSHFAVEAFEVDAVDYVMKPVSQNRLAKAMERITQKRLASDVPIVTRQEQTAFLNNLIIGANKDPNSIAEEAKSLGFDPAQPCSLFFIELSINKPHPTAELKQKTADALAEQLQTIPGLFPWNTPEGIGVLDFTLLASEDLQAHELTQASRIQALAKARSPEMTFHIGIAKRDAMINDFAQRYTHARNLAIIGKHTPVRDFIYHNLDYGFMPFLDQYVDGQITDQIIDSTIGKVLDFDAANGTDLFRTLEMIVMGHNLREIADTLFIHYKTVLFRKNNIEKILGVPLHSFAGQTTLGLALTLYYLRNHAKP